MRDEVNKANDKAFSIDQISGNLKDVLEGLQSNTKDMSDGVHGCTAEHWMGYIRMVMDWLELSRSIREGDFDLYVFTLKNISKFFFAFNQPNYDRWLAEYHSKLMKIRDTHPEIEKQFRTGTFGVRRSTKSFSRVPIDLTLEQTINADAASKKTGITISRTRYPRDNVGRKHILCQRRSCLHCWMIWD